MSKVSKKLPKIIETKRLFLRSPLPGDEREVRQAIIETFQDLNTWLIWAKKKPTLKEMKANIKKARKQFLARKDLRMHLYRKDTKEFVGVSGLHRIDWSVPKFEIAYWCRKKFQGQGYILEAAKAITNFAFKSLKARRVEIRVDEKNIKSKKIPLKLGFHFEGKVINHSRNPQGKLRNILIFAKTK
jgi:RimJ/RimL family protein N-acetyltransferase